MSSPDVPASLFDRAVTPLRVLVVDDEPLLTWAIAETLSAYGDITSKASTGAAAVHALSESPEPMDVMLLDYSLPDAKNLNVLQTARQLSPTTRVILMSARLSDDVATQALRLGAARVISKPIDMNDVPRLVHDTAAASFQNDAEMSRRPPLVQ